MKKKMSRWLSLLLVLLMVVSLVPAALAADEQKQSVTVQGSFRDGRLQLSDDQEADLLGYVPANPDRELTIAADKLNLAYLYVPYEDPTVEGWQEPIIPLDLLTMKDSQGNIAASWTGLEGKYQPWNKQVVITSHNLPLNPVPAPGDYTFTVTKDGKEFPASSPIQIISADSLVLTGLSLLNFVPGSPWFDAQLYIDGAATAEELRAITITVTDPETKTPVASSAGQFKDFEQSTPMRWGFTCRMKVAEGFVPSEDPYKEYDITIDYTGTKTLYNDLFRQNSQLEPAEAVISGVRCVVPAPATLQVQMKNTDPARNYTVTVKGYQKELVSKTLAAHPDENGVWTVELDLMQNGAPASMKELPPRLEVAVKSEGGYERTTYTYDNPYNQHNKLQYSITPAHIPATCTRIVLDLAVNGVSPLWKDSGNVLTLCRDYEGTDVVGTCTNLTMEREGKYSHILGTMDLQPLELPHQFANLNLFLNGVDIGCYIQMNERFLLNQYNIPYLDENTSSFYSLMDEMQLRATVVVATTGNVQVVFKDAQGQPAAFSRIFPLERDVNGNYSGVLHLTASDYAALQDGQSYEIFLRDAQTMQEQSATRGKLLTYDGSPCPTPAPGDLAQYLGGSCREGSTYLQVDIRQHNSYRNLTAAQCEEALSHMVLSNEETKEQVHFTGVEKGDFQRYQFRALLESPLKAGSYDILVDGVALQNRGVNCWKPEDPSDTPIRLGESDARTGTISVSHAPDARGYTAQLFLDYEAVTEPFPLTYQTAPDQTDSGWLYFEFSVCADLPVGAYRMVISLNGTILGETSLRVPDQKWPIIAIDDDDGQYNDSNDPVLHSRYLYMNGHEMGEYLYARAGLSREDLDTVEFDRTSSGDWYGNLVLPDTLPNGPIQILVDLSRDGKIVDRTLTLDRWLWLNAPYDLTVPESLNGEIPFQYKAYTLTAQTTMPAFVWITFYDVNGLQMQMMMPFSHTADGKQNYELRLPVGKDLIDYDSHTRMKLEEINKISLAASDRNGIRLPYPGESYGCLIRSETITRNISFQALPEPDSVHLFADGKDVTGQIIYLEKATAPSYKTITAQVLDQYGQVMQNQLVGVWSLNGTELGTRGNTCYFDINQDTPERNILTATVNIYEEEPYPAGEAQPLGGGQLVKTFHSDVTFVIDDGAPSFSVGGNPAGSLLAQRQESGTRLTWLCHDASLETFFIDWGTDRSSMGVTQGVPAETCKTIWPDVYTWVVPDWTDRGVFRVKAMDRFHHSAAVSVDTRAELRLGDQLLTGDDLWFASQQDRTYTLSTAVAAAGDTVTWSVNRWPALNQPGTDVPLTGSSFTLPANEGAARIVLTGTIQHQDQSTDDVTLAFDLLNLEEDVQCVIPVIPPVTPENPKPTVDVTVTLKKAQSLPVQLLLTGYDKDGRMVVQTVSAVLPQGETDARLSLPAAEGLTSVKLFLLDEQNNPIGSAISN